VAEFIEDIATAVKNLYSEFRNAPLVSSIKGILSVLYLENICTHTDTVQDLGGFFGLCWNLMVLATKGEGESI
jgi:hypothetical protein